MSAVPSISPSDATALLTVLCVFTLRLTVAYCAAWIVARLATSSSVRFAVWLVFLLSSAVYWGVSVGEVGKGVPRQEKISGALCHVIRSAPISMSPGSAHALDTAMRIGVGLYALALMGFVIVGLWKRMKLGRALRFKMQPGEPVSALFRELSEQMAAPSCRLWLLPGLPSPASRGWLRPEIYLPAEEGAAVTPQLRDILWHELSHVRRRDGLWDALCRICRCVLFFHPLMHRAVAAARLERELACDLNVVRQNPEKRHLYADTLVHFGWKTSLASQPDHLGIGFTSQAAVLNTRVKSILNGEPDYSNWSKWLRGLLSTAACWMLMAILPALWVGFAIHADSTLTGAPSIGAALVTPTLQVRHRARVLRSSKPLVALVRAAPTVHTSVSVDSALPSTAKHAPKYVLTPSADAPLWDPVAEGGSRAPVQGGAAPNSTGVPGQPARPSTTSILVDAAEQLGRMGVGRDHDHD